MFKNSNSYRMKNDTSKKSSLSTEIHTLVDFLAILYLNEQLNVRSNDVAYENEVREERKNCDIVVAFFVL